MTALYDFITGPMAWLSFAVFFGGIIFKLVRMVLLAREKDIFIFSYMSFRYGLRSILHWLTPFGTRSMRGHPLMTVMMFAFHICVIAAPLFVMAHGILIEEGTGVSWLSIPDKVADVMTVIVICSLLFFVVRRCVVREVRFVTTPSDFMLLSLVVAPFVTAFIAYHQWLDYRLFMIAHVISGEALLMAIPFTRLSHLIFSLFTRAYAGSEFGAVRYARDW